MQLNVLTNLVRHIYYKLTSHSRLDKFKHATVCNWLLNSKMHQYFRYVDETTAPMSKHILQFQDLRCEVQDNLMHSIDSMLTRQLFEMCMSTDSSLTDMADQSMTVTFILENVYTRLDEIKGKLTVIIGAAFNDKDSD